MKNVMGIINLIEKENFLREVSEPRPVGAVPIGGRYRIIDFPLSNLVNSGIRNVGILTSNKYRSIMDHLGNGKEWDLDRKRDGLFFLPPVNGNILKGTNKWDLRHLESHYDFIQYSRQQYVLLTGCNMICNVNFREAFQYHLDKKADVTILFKEMKIDEGPYHGQLLVTDQEDRVIDLAMNPRNICSNKLSMEMFIMEKSLLLELIDDCVSRGDCDFIRDVLVKKAKDLKILGFSHQSYLAHINSVKSYFMHHMDLLIPDTMAQLFCPSRPIYTRVRDGAPAKYLGDSQVENTLVANDCIIEGRVENSVLFRGIRIRKGAYVKDSIIMQHGEVEEGAVLENVIADKGVRVTQNKVLRGESHYPLVITKNMVI